MAEVNEVSKVDVNGTVYNIVDDGARDLITDLTTEVAEVRQIAEEAGDQASLAGLKLGVCTGITTKAAHGKAYIKWTDPEDMIVSGSPLATWAGTVLVRKAGSAPTNRKDGVIVVDSKTRNAYKTTYFCDSGLSDGTNYYYKLFPYTSGAAYTDTGDAFIVTPTNVTVGNVSGITLAPAGNGKLSIEWTDPDATVTSDGVTLATWANTKVVVKAGSYATGPNDSAAAFTNTSTTRNGHASSALIATGLTNGTTYYVSFFPTSTDGAVNTNTANRKTGVANHMMISTKPSQDGTLTYNGGEQSVSWSNYDSNKMTVGGTVKGTNAGSYNATFTPKADYMWDTSISSNQTAAVTVAWSIGKKEPSAPVLSKTSITFNMSTKSTTFTVTRDGDGTVTASSSNTGVATVSVSGTTVTVSSVNNTNGSATITVKVNAGTNYSAYTGTDATCAVTASFVSTTLNSNTWATIKAVSDAGTGSSYWSVGDTKTIIINGKVGTKTYSNISCQAFILGFNHNSSKEGNNRIHFQIGKISNKLVAFVDDNYGQWDNNTLGNFTMNPGTSGSYTNAGGWASCKMRSNVLGSNSSSATSPTANTFLAALPSDLRAVMKKCTKYTDNTGGGSDNASYVTATEDYLWLLAEWEYFGARTYANSAEKNSQAQYAYYQAGNAKIHYRHDNTGTAALTWERSPYYGYSSNFCFVYTNGHANINNASFRYGVAPGFCV